MSQLEKDSKKRTRRKNIRKIILGTVAVVGIMSIGAVAPNVLGAMDKLGLLPAKRQKEIIRVARVRLVKQGLLVYEGTKLRLTLKGEKVLRGFELKEYQIQKPRRWDTKWRVLIFDIPESRKSLRDKIRQTLQMVGFLRLQDSVWLYPYDCEDLIVLLKADFKIGKDLLYMIVESLEYDAPYRRHFNLPTE
jgi:hypothetical protein